MDQDLYDIADLPRQIALLRPQLFRNRPAVLVQGGAARISRSAARRAQRANAPGVPHPDQPRRRAQQEHPRKYEDDAAPLEKALATETDPFLISRYTFYLAQS